MEYFPLSKCLLLKWRKYVALACLSFSNYLINKGFLASLEFFG